MTWAPRLPLLDGKLDLVLITVLAWTVVRGLSEGLIWAAIGGALVDFYGVTPFGLGVLGFAAAAGLAGLGRWNFVRGSVVLAVVSAAAGTLIVYSPLLALLQALGRPLSWSAALQTVLLPAAIANSLAIVAIYAALVWLDRRLSGGEEPIGW